MQETYLIHFGIKGQKWGVRNGPPYPLDESQKRESELTNARKSIKNRKENILDFSAYDDRLLDPNIKGRKYLENNTLLSLDLQFFAGKNASNIRKLTSIDGQITWDTKPRQMGVSEYEKLVELWDEFYYMPEVIAVMGQAYVSEMNMSFVSSERGSYAVVSYDGHAILNGGHNRYKYLD